MIALLKLTWNGVDLCGSSRKDTLGIKESERERERERKGEREKGRDSALEDTQGHFCMWVYHANTLTVITIHRALCEVCACSTWSSASPPLPTPHLTTPPLPTPHLTCPILRTGGQQINTSTALTLPDQQSNSFNTSRSAAGRSLPAEAQLRPRRGADQGPVLRKQDVGVSEVSQQWFTDGDSGHLCCAPNLLQSALCSR